MHSAQHRLLAHFRSRRYCLIALAIVAIQTTLSTTEFGRAAEPNGVEKPGTLPGGEQVVIRNQPSASILAETLHSSNLKKAVSLLYQVSCLPGDSPSVQEVRRAWRERDSTFYANALRSPLVRTLLAKCVIEASQDTATDESLKESAAAQLRSALTDPDPAVVGVGMLGIFHVATKQDVKLVAAIALKQSQLAMSGIASLSTTCLTEAKTAIAEIQAAYAGSPLGHDIRRLVERAPVGLDSKFCAGKVSSTSMPNRRSAGALSGHPGARVNEPPSLIEVRDALKSTDPRAAQTLLNVRCDSDKSGAVEEVKRAWAAQDLEGLSRIAQNDDLLRIADVPTRIPKLRNVAVRDLSLACGPDAVKALSVIRESLPSDDERRSIDVTYEQMEPERQRLCHSH